MNSRFTLIVIALVVGFGGIFWFTKHKAAAPSGSSAAQLTNNVTGAGKKGVTLTEYGDFACPACYQYFPIVEQVRAKFGDDIKFQFRNFPLIEIHQNALIGARAGEAAALQGKFWEMYQQLYQNQPSWSDSSNPEPIFEQFATQIGLNVDKFRTDIKSEQVNNSVQADRNDAKSRGFSGTPTFLINNKQVTDTPRDEASFEKLINDAIAAAKA